MIHVAAFCYRADSVAVIQVIGSASQDAPICEERSVIAELQVIRELSKEQWAETFYGVANGQSGCGGPCMPRHNWTSTSNAPPGTKTNARYGANAHNPAHARSIHSTIELFMGSMVATGLRDYHCPKEVP